MTAVNLWSDLYILASNTRRTCRCTTYLRIPLIITFKQLALIPREQKIKKVSNNHLYYLGDPHTIKMAHNLALIPRISQSRDVNQKREITKRRVGRAIK